MKTERKIGEIFEYKREWYQCMKGNICNDCAFYRSSCGSLTGKGNCRHDFRGDATNVIFKKLEKLGEPYKFHKRTIQTYKLYTEPFISVDMDFINTYLNGSNTIDIIIKQDIENMEEKKLNLKPFDIEAAKAGKLVYTRNGRKARIICFDAKFPKTGNIVTLVEKENGEEVTLYHYDDGHCSIGRGYDLMMSTEKKEGWVNIYKGGLLDTKSYSSKEEAVSKASQADYIDTIKIEWEE